MNARICTNPSCRAIQPGDKCHLCGTCTHELPVIPLQSIGLDGTARLTHQSLDGYSILITTSSGPHRMPIAISDLVHAAQLHLPNINHVSGLMVMDALKVASNLVKTKHTCLWSGWVIYLLESLQEHTDNGSFQHVLLDLLHDIQTTLLEADPPLDTP